MANTYTLIASSTVGSGGAANMDFQNIPSTYTDLMLRICARSTQSNVVGTMVLEFNASSANFTSKFLEGSASAVSSYSGSNYVGPVTGDTATASTFGSIDFYVPNYTGSAYKSFSSDSVTENNATAAYQALGAGLWSQTAAITRITIAPSSGSFKEYSTAYLYGISNS